MEKEICIVQANCQGEPLLNRLAASPEFEARYDCRLFTNYIKEPIPDELFGRCSLFLYQYLNPDWGEFASEHLLRKLPDSARSLCLPNMFFKGYWPFWSGELGFDYRCTHLDEIIALELPPEETILLFLRSDVTKRGLSDRMKASIQQEREREKHTPVKYLDFIVENYGRQRLFNTVNHPGSILMNIAARGVLEQLDLQSADEAVLEAMGEPFPEFEQPINPKVAQANGWDFADPDTLYQVYGRKLTFARYIANYVIAKQQGVADFIGFFQGDQIVI